ncbi:MAG: hypothetical protein V7K35_08710 [Nostoc sp.]|uniref:hypothetical protein n=1 Tax=Nostoc sp. TaxID=1180 RepID=UPI002FF72D4F
MAHSTVGTHVVVEDAASLAEAVQRTHVVIEVAGRLHDLEKFTLLEGSSLVGTTSDAELVFKPDSDGVALTANNTLQNLTLRSDPSRLTLSLESATTTLGQLKLQHLVVYGRLHLESSIVMTADLVLTDVQMYDGDSTSALHRPVGYGVEVVPGSLTIYNRCTDPQSRWTLRAENLSGGTRDVPLRGSGIFIFGGMTVPANADPQGGSAPSSPGGMIDLKLLTTGEIHTNGNIPAGTGNLISGGVFVGSGVKAQQVINNSPVTTYGTNDMVLDNWGNVRLWLARQSIISHGTSGIGFVNFGDLQTLIVQGDLATYGEGARGFNLYDGTLAYAEFKSITTHGNGSIGIQTSKPFGSILVLGDVITKGSRGNSLVRGVVVQLDAHALSLKPGTSGKEIIVLGRVEAQREEITSLDFAAPASTVEFIMIGGQQYVDGSSTE